MKKFSLFFLSAISILILIITSINITATLNELGSPTSKALEANSNASIQFYGATEINLLVGDAFDLKSPVFRIFAQDEIGSDLTQKIKVVSNNVNMKKAGNYKIKYRLDGYNAEIEVPVRVRESGERTVQRTLYHTKDFKSSEAIEQKKGLNQDKQNLGIYIKKNASLYIRGVENNCGFKVSLLNDDRKAEVANQEIGAGKEWSKITAKKDSVPFVQTNSMTAKKTYKLGNGGGITGNSVSNFILYENRFETDVVPEKIESFNVGIWDDDCKIEIYIKDGDKEYKRVDNGSGERSGYNYIYKLNEPITIENKNFSVAIKYFGKWIPVLQEKDDGVITYVSKELGNEWSIKKGNNIRPVSITTTKLLDKVEIKIDDLYNKNSGVSELNYYLKGDKENEFINSWNSSKNSLAVAEDERVTFLIPYKDLKENNILQKDSNAKDANNRFKTFDEIFKFYDDLFETYDTYSGLDFNASDVLDQNYKVKYFLKADINGPGYAFYGPERVGFTGDTIKVFFKKSSWSIVHEIGHGYEGTLSRRDVDLRETQNNVFAYFFQIKELGRDYSGITYKHSKNRTYSEGEKEAQAQRKAIMDNNIKMFSFDYTNYIYKDMDILDYECINKEKPHLNYIMKSNFNGLLTPKLYSIVNLLDKTGVEKSLSTLYKNARREINNNPAGELKVADLMARSYSTDYNVIPYLETWGLDNISADVKKQLADEDKKAVWYLYELLNNENEAEKIRQELGLRGIYSLVDNDQLKKYNHKGNVKLNLTDEQFRRLKDKDIVLKDGSRVIKTIKITSKNMNIADIPIGIYEIETKNASDKIEPIYVVSSAEAIKLNESEINLFTKQTFQLEANSALSNDVCKDAKWKSTNAKVAKVDGNGKITACGVGKTEIVASSAGKFDGICKVNVKQGIDEINIRFEREEDERRNRDKSWSIIYNRNITKKCGNR